MRREPAFAVGLLAAGSGLLFVAASTGPTADGASGLALVSGAGAAAVLAARGWMRRIVGGVLVLAGLSALLVGFAGGSWTAVAGGACVVAGGGWVASRGPRWSRMSDRYERVPTATDTPHALWDALDHGDDPTR